MSHFKTKNAQHIIAIMLVCCAIMAVVDAVVRPPYFVKSLCKLALFLACPIVYAMHTKDSALRNIFRAKRGGIAFAIGAGMGILMLIVGGFLLVRPVFDFSGVTASLTQNIGVSKENFLLVSVYIACANSLLEEFFFRGFGFLVLKRYTTRQFAYGFSALCFALYHVAMMIGWFHWLVFALMLVGLVIGGVIFNYFDERYDSIYLSWLVHLCANLGTSLVGCMLFGIL